MSPDAKPDTLSHTLLTPHLLRSAEFTVFSGNTARERLLCWARMCLGRPEGLHIPQAQLPSQPGCSCSYF